MCSCAGEEGKKTRSWSGFFSCVVSTFIFYTQKQSPATPLNVARHTPKHYLFLFFLFNFNFKDLSFSCSGGWCHTNDQRLLTGCSLHNCWLSICLWLFRLSRGCRRSCGLCWFLLLFFRLGLCCSLNCLETRSSMFSNTAEEIQEVALFCHGKAQHDNYINGMQHM